LLEAHRDVHRGARCKWLAGRGVAGEYLACVDPDPHPDSNLCSQLSSELSAINAREGRAPREPHRASSSCICGTPETAIAASPMNFDRAAMALDDGPDRVEVPPHDARRTSGSRAAAKLVDSTMSANRTVAVWRRSPVGCSVEIGAAGRSARRRDAGWPARAAGTGDGSMPSSSTSVSRAPVRLECSACSRSGRGQHELPAQSLAQRVLGDEGLELTDQLGMTAHLEFGVDQLFARGRVKFLDSCHLDAHEGLEREVGQRRPTPEAECLAQEL
jgi:hypothetical protein